MIIKSDILAKSYPINLQIMHTFEHMKKLIKPLLGILFLIGLIFFQRESVMPFVYKVIQSDLFLEDSDDLGDTIAINNFMTNYAHKYCNIHIKKDYGNKFALTLAEKPINTWNIGNHDYVVNGEIIIQSKSKQPLIKKYACRIKHAGGDPNNFDNWSLGGISGLL